MQKKGAECPKSSTYHTDLDLQLRLLSEEQEQSNAEIWEAAKSSGTVSLPTIRSIAVRTRKKELLCEMTRIRTLEDMELRRTVCFSCGEVQLGYLQEAVVSRSWRIIELSVST